MAENKEKRYVSDNAQLMTEWDWDENIKQNLNPEKLTFGSAKKANWVCSNGHKWVASIYHRASRGSKCPYCSNKRIIPGYNDLQSQRPDLMSEWNFEENTIDPSTIAVKSNKVAHWICPKGHKYKKTVYARIMGGDCPVCARARSTSFPEQCFFYYVKKVYPDAINSYREIFDNGMELDIYIPSIRTGIEYDGIFWHNSSSLSREEKKYKICKENQIRLFRIKEGDFVDFSNTADRVWYIPKKCEYRFLDLHIEELLNFLTFWADTIPSVDVRRDKNEILEYKTLNLEESLLFLYPQIAQEWHPIRNGKLTPDLFIPGSTDIVWWLCPNCGNEWKSSIVNRTKGHGCNVCATHKRKITKKNTLISKRGSIDKEWCLLDWDYEKNEYGPEHYTNGSGEKVSWHCHICGHRWKATICDRTRNHKNGCPLCSGKTIVTGINDLQTLKPELINEWDYTSNVGIDPKEIGRGSHLVVSWICSKCSHKWDSRINNRANGKGCPECAKRLVSEKKRNLAIEKNGTLADNNPLLAAQWHLTKNGNLTPSQITAGNDYKAWWLCPICGHEWSASVGSRNRGAGCPQCARQKYKKDN